MFRLIMKVLTDYFLMYMKKLKCSVILYIVIKLRLVKKYIED
jgi:hypothetical protein